MATIVPDGRHWKVFDDDGSLIAITVYKVGATSVKRLADNLQQEITRRTQVHLTDGQLVKVVHADDDTKAQPIPIIW